MTSVVVTGNCDDVIDVPENFQISFVDLTYEGNSNFVVTVLDSNNELEDLLVNEIGNYTGRRSIGFWQNDPHRLLVTTQGQWTVTINPLEKAYFHICEIPGACSGKGDDVIVFSQRPDVGVIQHTGNSNFIVIAGADRPGVLVNEIGSYTGKLVFPSGTRFVEIQADGEWTMIVAD